MAFRCPQMLDFFMHFQNDDVPGAGCSDFGRHYSAAHMASDEAFSADSAAGGCVCCTAGTFCMLVYCGASVVLRALQGAENRTYPL